VRDLLCHQTGLPRYDWVWIPGDRSAAELLGPMRHLELSRDIRAAWRYNNLCYNVVVRAAGRTTHHPGEVNHDSTIDFDFFFWSPHFWLLTGPALAQSGLFISLVPGVRH